MHLSWFLRTLAVLAFSSACGPDDTASDIPFAVRIEQPARGAPSLHGRVEVTGTASAPDGIVRVALQVDGGPLQPAEGTGDWRFLLDTRALSEGRHTLTAWATNTAGQTVSSSSRQVEVANHYSLEVGSTAMREGRAGGFLLLEAELHNVGPAPVTLSPLEWVGQLPPGSTLGAGEVVLASEQQPVTLAAGESRTLQVRVRVPPTEPDGTWQVHLRVHHTGTDALHEGAKVALPVRREVELTAAVRSRLLFDAKEPLYEQTFRLAFEGLTADNEMKIAQMRPERDRYEFTDADRLVDYATGRGLSVHGHTLVWHNSLPAWLTQTTWRRDELTAVLEEYVRTVVGRWKGRVASWDVVNEAFNDDGTWRATSFWYQQLGKDYVEIAFRAAHAADPDALLYYNDYGAERVNAKSEAILGLVDDLRARGVPIHGVGLQGHVTFNYYPTRQQLAEVLQRYAARGLATRLTELDVRTSSHDGTDQEKLALQAQVYRGVAEACHQVAGCLAVTTWGFTDKYSWLNPAEMPLPFDTEYRPKPAWTALQAGVGR